MFPTTRPRRLRQTPMLRNLVRETSLSMSDLIAPLFVVEGAGIKTPITTLPGHYHLSPDMAAEEAQRLFSMGITSVILFGIPDHKDAEGSESWNSNGVVQQAIRTIKQAVPDLIIMADLCFCEYTSHGQCGVLHNHLTTLDKPTKNFVDNDATLELTKKQTLSLAEAGADVIAPSGMMDGVVKTIRTTLDDHSFTNTIIMSYSAKYASAYYGPFREAAGSTPSEGDRKNYQMDPANRLEAQKEIKLDLQEGADIVMVKPALAYLDIIRDAKAISDVPVAAYNVSGEYAMIKAAASQGLVDEDAIIYETLLSIKRAGADIIISYFADDLAQILGHSTVAQF